MINQTLNVDVFTAFSVRLFKLLEQKMQSISTTIDIQLPTVNSSNRPFLRLQTISNIVELFPFFNHLVKLQINNNLYLNNEPIVLSNTTNNIEISVLEDFVECWF